MLDAVTTENFVVTILAFLELCTDRQKAFDELH